MNATLLPSSAASQAARRALWTVSITAALAATSHSYDFGATAFVAGALVIALLAFLARHFRRTGGWATLGVFLVLAAWIIVGFGLVGGLWSHGAKLLVAAIHGGAVPDALRPYFVIPDVEPAFYETIGVLTAVAACIASTAVVRLARSAHADARERRMRSIETSGGAVEGS